MADGDNQEKWPRWRSCPPEELERMRKEVVACKTSKCANCKVPMHRAESDHLYCRLCRKKGKLKEKLQRYDQRGSEDVGRTPLSLEAMG